ncbi:uncharacterized protein FIBRA_04195 [Fibroporia radiculosa]|uniref:choline-phosphate cytidylyltransferase n=1 Tax=Fibroporia radiculosa TaxID=599839 RepID=J4G6Z7_9APHY|nr:uncharacterized protein FIBRA_04195 [Fibroporia radiculosa]CCM02118.1 predicted protein [Fibroporia radiculosa]
MDAIPAKRTLHSKRSFGTKHAAMAYPHAHNHPHSRAALDSPAAYDASEEDNDPLTDDASSAISVLVPSARLQIASGSNPSSHSSSASRSPAVSRPPPRPRHVLVALVSDDDAGTDSPTYDGDIESSTMLGANRERDHDYDSSSTHYAPSSASTLTSPSNSPPPSLQPQLVEPLASTTTTSSTQKGNPAEPPPAPIAIEAFNPARLTPEDIQEYVRQAIAREGEEGAKRPYKINPPPKDRPARVYADGVYDLFHFGHALQLRQAKLSFPPIPVSPTSLQTHGSNQSDGASKEQKLQYHKSPNTTPSASSSARPSPLDTAPPSGTLPGVYLLAGVNSDEQCTEHKNLAVMSHAERCEAVRHCRWIDEVLPDAPWVIGEEFLQKHQIDYVAHDEDPYVSAGIDDVYGYCKQQGKFIPTRRTPGVSTSDLLERIVSRYRMRVFDKKLARMGHAELMAEGSDYDDSAPVSRLVSRAGSPGADVPR